MPIGFTLRDFNDEFDQLPLVILAKNKKSQKPIVHDTQLHLLQHKHWILNIIYQNKAPEQL